jgi:hypothetical protein
MKRVDPVPGDQLGLTKGEWIGIGLILLVCLVAMIVAENLLG